MRMRERWTIDVTPRPGAWRLPMLISIIVGAAHGASFAPVVSWWTELVALALLVGIVARSDSGRIALLSGFGFGLGWFATGVYWIYISMHDYGHMAAWLAVLALLLLCLYLALYPALAVWSWWHLRMRLSPGWHAILFALLWAASEWLRATLFTGFPWIGTGYAHVDGPLAGYAAIGGVHVVSLLAAFVAAAVAVMLDGLFANDRLRMPRNRRTALATTSVALAIVVVGIGLAFVRWTAPAGAPLSVRLLQGNVPQDMKFEPAHLIAQYKLYLGLIQDQPADLIVLPETALPLPIQDSPPGYFDSLAQYAQAWNTTIVSGVFVLERDAATGADLYTNAAVAVGPNTVLPITDHTGLTVYRKHHLVPFGEYIPFGTRWFVDAMVMPIGDQQHGAASQPSFVVPRRDGSISLVGMNICYEDYFGDEIAVELQREDAPQILINLTNIAWFGDTAAVPQHLLASRMRSLETGRPMLRATNTGATAVIGPDGKVHDQLPAFTRGSLNAEVQGMQGLTPYARWLDWPFIAGCFGALALALWRSRRH